MKVTEFPSITTLDGAQVFLVDGASGTKKILASDLLFALEHLNSPQITHRNTFRGKSLGTAVTSAPSGDRAGSQSLQRQDERQ